MFEYHSWLLLRLVDIRVPYLMRNQAQKYYFQNFTKMIFKPTLVSHKASWKTAKRCVLPQNSYYILCFFHSECGLLSPGAKLSCSQRKHKTLLYTKNKVVVNSNAFKWHWTLTRSCYNCTAACSFLL